MQNRVFDGCAPGASGRTVRTAVVGLGCRGYEQLKILSKMPDVEIVSLCDVYEDRVQRAAELVRQNSGQSPHLCRDWRESYAQKPEAVIIMTSWQTHIPLAIAAMRQGIIPGMEVGGASSVRECWDLVRASEDTGIPCMLLENCCYGREEMTLLNMVRQGLFGEVVHCEGGYLHDLRDEIGLGDVNRHYRQDNFMHRNGELYPTHELGPIAQYLDINHGNRMVSLVSMASKAAGQKAWMRENRKEEDKKALVFNEGDVVTTLIQCANGETITLKHDCTLPRPYSRGGLVQGTRGIWEEDNRSLYLDGVSPVDPTHWTHRWEKDEAYMQQHLHPLWQQYEAFGRQGGHGGMDYLVLRAFFEAIQQGKPFPIDVYDTAAWMAVTPLSEASIAMGSAPVAFPDFTNGEWMTR